MLAKLFPLQEKTVGFASFGDNIYYTTRALRKSSNEPIIIVRDSMCKYEFDESIATIIPFHLTRPIAYIKSIYHLATATTILVDNYFGFLAVTKFRKGATCIQLWHATGALKKFGLQDPSIKNRTPKAIKRFQQVYNRFHYITVGSDRMAEIFEESFGRPSETMLRTGVPRTDFFYNQLERNHALQAIDDYLPHTRQKKVILYAPTFRENQLNHYRIQLDVSRMYEELSQDYILLIKNHPAVRYELQHGYEDFVFDVTDYYDVNHLLLVTDILITDYSSVPCEFSIFHKPIIFYAYDLTEYPGLRKDYVSESPGPIVYTTEEIITTIKEENVDLEKIAHFSSIWNKYSKGNSSNHLVDFIMERKSPKHQVG